MSKNRFILGMFLTALFSAQNIFASEEVDEDKELIKTLSTLQDPDVAQKTVRYYAQGNREHILTLFQKASSEKASRAQIFIANAYVIGSIQNKDELKDWDTISTPSDLETHYLPHRSFDCVGGVLKEMDSTLPYEKRDKITQSIFCDARTKESIYAHLVEILHYGGMEWGFWHAAKLRPYLETEGGTWFKILYYFYGQALSQTSSLESPLFYEGLFYLEKSQLAEKDEDFKQDYLAYKSFVDSATLSPLEVFDCFSKRDLNDLKNLSKLYKNHSIGSSSWIQGFIYTLRLYANHKELGKISIDASKTDNFKFQIVERIENYPVELAPLMEFMEDMMSRSGSPSLVNQFFQLSEYALTL